MADDIEVLVVLALMLCTALALLAGYGLGIYFLLQWLGTQL